MSCIFVLCNSKRNSDPLYTGEGSKLVDIRFTNIVREDPEQCFSALLRIDGGFTRALQPKLSQNCLELAAARV